VKLVHLVGFIIKKHIWLYYKVYTVIERKEHSYLLHGFRVMKITLGNVLLFVIFLYSPHSSLYLVITIGYHTSIDGSKI